MPKKPESAESSATKPVVFKYRSLPTMFVPVCIALSSLFFGTWVLGQYGGISDISPGTSSLVSTVQRLGRNGFLAPPPDPNLIRPEPPVTMIPGTPDEHDEVFDPELWAKRAERTQDGISTLLLAFGALSLFLAFAGRDKRLSMSTEGILFPKGMAAALGWKRKRAWSDLVAIDLASNPKRKTKQELSAGQSDSTDAGDPAARPLVLLFNPSGKASIYPDRLTKPELDQFFHSLDELAPQVIRSPELVAFRHKLFSDQGAGNSFTQLWESELATHFSATNFVALSPGQELQNGKIKITMHLSSGGLSAVYLAEQGRTMVVLKESVVPPGTSETSRSKAAEMFQREASMLKQVNHPQIAKVFDHFQEQGRDYLLLEYIPGITLREYVRRNGAQDSSKVMEWARQIAMILGYLHEQDPPIIHRDITPDNLIITPEGKVVLIDFGAANQFLGSATGTIIGKQFYISPEQFRGKAEPASDLYALGGTMYYLMTGKDPEALSSSRPGKIKESINTEIDNLVAKCTELDLQKRFSSASEVVSAIDALSAPRSDAHLGAETSAAVAIKIEKKENESVYR